MSHLLLYEQAAETVISSFAGNLIFNTVRFLFAMLIEMTVRSSLCQTRKRGSAPGSYLTQTFRRTYDIGNAHTEVLIDQHDFTLCDKLLIKTETHSFNGKLSQLYN